MAKYSIAGRTCTDESELVYLSNSKRPHGNAYLRYEVYQYCKTIGEYFELAESKYARADLNWDFRKGLVAIDGLFYEGEE